MAALVFSGCGGSGDHATPNQSTTSSRPTDLDVMKIDYGPALLSADDLAIVADDFSVAAQLRTAGTRLPTLCGQRRGADAGC